jgi:hypothetical protein
LPFLGIVIGLPVLLVLVIAIGARLRGSTAIVLCVVEFFASLSLFFVWLTMLGASGALS